MRLSSDDGDGGCDGFEAVNGCLEEGASCSEEVEEKFRAFCSGEWPESCSGSACGDDDVEVAHVLSMEVCGVLCQVAAIRGNNRSATLITL